MKEAREFKVGEKTMPPKREISLWMKRECESKNIPISALELTIIKVGQGKVDKGGQWIRFACSQTAEWTKDQVSISLFQFSVRPGTLMPTC